MKKLTVDSIVKDYLIELGAETDNDKRYPRLLHFALNGMRDMNHKNKNYTAVATLDISDNDVVALPDNYIDYRSIAICVGGEKYALSVNNNLCYPSTNDCGVLDSANLTSNDSGDFYLYSDGHSYSNYGYGKPGGNNGIGYFRIFPQEGYIAISLTGEYMSTTVSSVVMEYKADITSVNGEFLVHPYDVEPLKAYMEWASRRRTKSTSRGEIIELERTYNRLNKIARKLKADISLKGIVDYADKGVMSTPR